MNALLLEALLAGGSENRVYLVPTTAPNEGIQKWTRATQPDSLVVPQR